MDVMEDVDAIVVAGGDGTLAEVCNYDVNVIHNV